MFNSFKWYLTNNFCSNILQEWETCGLNPELNFPDKNPFIPDSLKIKVTKKEVIYFFFDNIVKSLLTIIIFFCQKFID